MNPVRSFTDDIIIGIGGRTHLRVDFLDENFVIGFVGRHDVSLTGTDDWRQRPFYLLGNGHSGERWTVPQFTIERNGHQQPNAQHSTVLSQNIRAHVTDKNKEAIL